MTEAELEAWCADHRTKVVEYLARQKDLQHGAVGTWPAWRVTPHISLWAVESVRMPGAIGWWVICGDLPTDYCSGDGCRVPRLAIERIAESWVAALAEYKEGDAFIGTLGIDGALAPLLRTRAETLLDYVADDTLWPDEPF